MYSIVDRESSRDMGSKASIVYLTIILLFNFYLITIPGLYSSHVIFPKGLVYPPGYQLLKLSYSYINLQYFKYSYPLFHFLIILGIFLIGKEIANRRTGLYSALIFVCYSNVINTIWISSAQLKAMPFIILGFYFLMRARNRLSMPALWVSTALFAFASLFLYSPVLFLLPILIVEYQINPRDKNKIFPLVLISILPLALLLIGTVSLFPEWMRQAAANNYLRLGITDTNEILPVFAFFKGLWRFLFFDAVIFLGLLGLFFYRAKYPWYLYYAVLATAIGSISGQSIYTKSIYPPLALCLPFVVLGTGRMAQIMIDNLSSLINNLVGFSKDPQEFVSPGKIIALLGFAGAIYLLVRATFLSY